MLPDLVRSFCVLVGAFLLALSCTGPQSQAPEKADETRVYHVQIQMTEEKDKADQTLGQALRWWKELPASKQPPLAGAENSPVHIEWQAPLYRVRLGPFATREQAEAVLTEARSAFPDAFVAPERVSTK